VAVNIDPGDSPTSTDAGPRLRIVASKSLAKEAGRRMMEEALVGSKAAGGGEKNDAEVLGKKRALKKAKGKSPLGKSQVAPQVLWNGKWIRGHLLWMTKDVCEKTDAEVRSAEILHAMSDWMEERRSTITEVLTFLLPEKVDNLVKLRGRAGSKRSIVESDSNAEIVPHEVLMQTVEFMSLEASPSREDFDVLFGLIKEPAKEEIDIALLKEVFIIVDRLNESLERAKNCFLKDPSHMSQSEYSASMFFKEFQLILETNNWTPQELFKRIDPNMQGDVDKADLEREVRTLLKTQPVPMTMALCVEHPFDIMDINGDGTVSCEEFVKVFEYLKEAREAQKDSEQRHPIFTSASGMPKPGPNGRKVFGHQAFVECLLKIGLANLSFHGTSLQAEQTSVFKVLWLLLYLHGNFKLAATKAKSVGKSSQTAHSPMQRLLKEHPDVFQKAGQLVDTAEETEECRWGSKVDGLLRQCLEETPRPRAAGQNSIDRQLLSLALN
jgi:hypothetical protein